MHTADVPQENPEYFFFLTFRRWLFITDVQYHVLLSTGEEQHLQQEQ